MGTRFYVSYPYMALSSLFDKTALLEYQFDASINEPLLAQSYGFLDVSYS